MSEANEFDCDLVLHGARVVAPAGDVDGGGIAVRDGRIVSVGPDAELAAWRSGANEVVDASGQLLAPGLVNTHCHAGDSLFRGLVENLSLEAWLEKVWIAESAILDPHTTSLGAQLGLAENLLAGVTSVFDMFWFPDTAAEAARQLGMRVATGGLFFDGVGIDGKEQAVRLDEARAFCETWRDEPLVTPSLNPHATYTVGPQQLEGVARLAEETGALVTVHAAETRQEQSTARERFDATVLQHLEAVGLLGPQTVLAHCVHLEPGDLEIIRATDSTVAHNPVSNLKLGSGIAPVPEMLDAGVRVTLGTDGPISGNDMDPWLGLRLAAILHKGRTMNPTTVSARQAFDMATVRGAEAMRLDTGVLEAGRLADFILLDLDGPHATPLFDAVHHLVFAAGRADVRDVYVGGRRVVENRRLVHLDLDAVREEIGRLAPRIAATLEGAAG
ncbi:MAG: amidohydrolase [Acidobacteriota bacterium]